MKKTSEVYKVIFTLTFGSWKDRETMIELMKAIRDVLDWKSMTVEIK